MARMQSIMKSFRSGITEIAGKKILEIQDYSKGLRGLPKSDVLKFLLEDHCSVVVRPSGTEPKLKAYISVTASGRNAAAAIETQINQAVKQYM